MRNRLIVAVAVVAAAIGAAGTPSVLTASAQLKDAQDLVTLAERTEDALGLAQSIADERDAFTVYLATGRAKSSTPDAQLTARVDRQITDLRTAGDLPADLTADLDGIAAVRKSALDGKSGALDAHNAYTVTITELHRLAEELAEQSPSRAGSGAYALAELDSAVQQAAAARGLLVAALSIPSSSESSFDTSDSELRDQLTAAAQQARFRSDAALADFRETGRKTAVSSYDSTVTGSENDAAEKYLTTLTAQPTLTSDEVDTSASKVNTALSARLELMRGAEAALFDRRTKEFEQLRDDDVTALEIRVAALGALMLLAVGVASGMARSLTRPLSAVRRGAARLAEAEQPGAEEPVKFTGRNDEFAQVVRSINALHAHAAGVHERLATLEADRKHLVGQRQKMADAREELRAELADVTVQLERLRTSIGSTFVNLALRTLGLVERQLTVIEGMEEREQDPDRLATLFKLDHFATVMRRHSENLLVLAGTEHVQPSPGPVPLVDVVRAAVSEIERYERVRIASLPPHAHIAGFAADDLSHLLAELLENATSFSPPDSPVEVSGWLLENGDVMLSVQDEGLGVPEERAARFNARLADFDPETPFDQEGEEGLGLGLYVVARLAHRHGVRVRLRAGEGEEPGTTAVTVVPTAVLAPSPTAATPASAPARRPEQTPGVSLPGADAEVNSHVIGGRSRNKDLAVELAERAIEKAQAEGTLEETDGGDTEPAEHPGHSEHAEHAVAADEAAPVSESEPPQVTSETTLALFVPVPQEEEDAEAAGVEEEHARADEPAEEPVVDPGDGDDEQVTDKGLPKRTPKVSVQEQVPRPRAGGVDADALRRKLGGFRQGAEAGYREAEIEEKTGRNKVLAPKDPGGPVEEASS